MDLLTLTVLVGAGLVAGYINATAGAGSLLTLPALIFSGLDASAANATNRVAVLIQLTVAWWTYHQGGVRLDRRVGWTLVAPALVASLGGAWVAAQWFTHRQLQGSIVIAMCVFAVLSLVPSKPATTAKSIPSSPPSSNTRRQRAGTPESSHVGLDHVVGKPAVMLLFAAIGAYAGFLQAGAGVLILLTLSRGFGVPLVIGNAIKVAVLAVLTLPVLLAFLYWGEQVDWFRGLVLAFGTTVGARLGALHTLSKGESFARTMLLFSVGLAAVKLAWDLW